MNPLEIQSIINAKEKRQFVLEKRKKNILKIDESISNSSFNKNLKGFYYFFKKYILLGVGFIFVLLAIILLTKPDVVFNTEIQNRIKENLKKEYIEEERDRLLKIVDDNFNKEIKSIMTEKPTK